MQKPTVAALALAFAAACSAKASQPFPDVQSFCNAKAKAECQVAMTCGIDVADCEVQRVSLCNLEAMTAETSGSRTRHYSPANAADCITTVGNAYGKTQIPFSQLVGSGSLSDICQRVFTGDAAVNDPCETSYDCAKDLVCAPVTPGSATTVCAAAVNKSQGDFCQDPGSICPPDTYCAMPPTGGGYQCLPAKQQGQPCDAATAPCVSTQRCEAGAGATGFTCEPRVAAAQPCATNDDCAPDAPYCDPYVGNLCTKGLSFATLAPDCNGFKSGGPIVVDAGAE
jgi:hypothetical protein